LDVSADLSALPAPAPAPKPPTPPAVVTVSTPLGLTQVLAQPPTPPPAKAPTPPPAKAPTPPPAKAPTPPPAKAPTPPPAPAPRPPTPTFKSNEASNAYSIVPLDGDISKLTPAQQKLLTSSYLKEAVDTLGLRGNIDKNDKTKTNRDKFAEAIAKYKRDKPVAGKGFKFSNMNSKVLGKMIHNKILANRLKTVHPALLGGALAHDLIHRHCNYHMKENPKVYSKIKKEADKHLMRLNKLHGAGWFSNLLSKAVGAGKSISSMAQSAKAQIQPMLAKVKPYIDQGIALAKEQAPKLAKAGLKQAVSMGLNFVPMGATIQSAIAPHIDKLIDKGVDKLTAKLINSPPPKPPAQPAPAPVS